MRAELAYKDGLWLPRGHDSLALGVPSAAPGAVHALASGGGYSVQPGEGRIVYFGRNRPEVHICVGEDDRQVSRVHGELAHRQSRWWLRNVGRQPIRLPKSRWLFPNEAAFPLADGYTPIHIPGSRQREHLVEVYVTALDQARHNDETVLPEPYHLTTDERLVLVVLGQRYLSVATSPEPLTWDEAARHLTELQPEAAWTPKAVEHYVALVRERLHSAGVPDLMPDELASGNAVTHNVLKELVRSMTLLPSDLTALHGSPP
ncbi:FHA domain-containing protein [Actinocrispum wychmicini]|uniref:FHA domain-containing protein n=1 Tax=Actinocrispum wychmicini TaxID=1213861 RepID=A0A4R2IIX0_9PSEU|nr:FHA domain-containing protein [Actinocrispum wychmicini]TCO44282.1 hypothetical protein EV192_12455 [Actinocrispum wychmicini]